MRRYGNFLGRMIVALAIVCLFFQQPVSVRAEVVEAELITVETVEDFTVMFEYEGERPEIVFISPSGKEYGEGISSENELKYAHGEGWSTYKVIAAECGTWKIRCDKKNNAYVEYGFIEAIDGLAIQSFDIISMQGQQAVLLFDVSMGEDEMLEYQYSVSVIAGENTNAGKKLVSGKAYTGTPKEITVNLNFSSYNEYRFLLEVTATQGLEMYDSMVSEPFAYANPNSPEKLQDAYVLLNLSAQKCELDWAEFGKGRNTEYHVVVFTDADSENPIYSNATTECEDVFFYPVDTKKVIINLYYKVNGILSEALVKEIDLVNGEALQIVTPEVTASSQMELTFRNQERTVLFVKVNEQNGSYNLMEPGSLYFPLQSGVNEVEAFFQGAHNITYYVSADIFLDTTPPELILYENFDGMTFKKGEVIISGEVDNAEKLLVNGVEVIPEAEGVFSHTVSLSNGENDIVLVVESATGVRIQRSMKVIRMDGVATETVKEYRPVFVLGGAVLVLVIFVLCVIGRRKNRTLKRVYVRFAVGLGILLALFEAGCIAMYVHLKNFNTSKEYVELARKSVVEAAKYLEYQADAWKAIWITAAVFGANVLIGVLVKVISVLIQKKREK